MGRKISIAVAPTGGWGAGNNNPLTSSQIAEEVIGCVQAGASIVHMHSRDSSGSLTAGLEEFNATVEQITGAVDIILEASTGGLSDLSTAERVLPVSNPFAELGSLNIGSLNFGDQVYKNSLPDIRYWIAQMKEAGVKPSVEIFDTGHLETALNLIHEGLLVEPCNFSFIFNVQWGMRYDMSLLRYLVSRLPQSSCWGVIFVGSRDFSAHLEAAAAGASILRVGFEDSVACDGTIAVNNVALVAALKSALEQAGYDILSTEDTRSILLR